jgi:putative acetyltransferase
VVAPYNQHDVSITVREMKREEAALFVEIHHAAVRGLAATDYPIAVIEHWAPPITAATIERFLSNRDRELRLIAELDRQPAGIGAIVVSKAELRACYVAPHAARRGVGSALVAELERIARAHRLEHLELESSITAEPFYSALGYNVVQRGELRISPTVRMASVTMRKPLLVP